MRSSTSSSDPAATREQQAAARTWLWIFAVFAATATAMQALSILTPMPHGDLSRISRVRDAVFGWTRPQPMVPAELQRAVGIADADVLVVGDSFSVGLVWQSRLVKAGYRVAMIHWDDAQPHCRDFRSWVRERGFRGSWLIFETVERSLDQRIRANGDCVAHRRPEVAAYSTPPSGPLPGAGGLNWKSQFTTGLVSVVNDYRARTTTKSIVFWNGARLAFVKDGCRLFSHSFCDRVLVLADDERARRLDADMIGPMKTWAAGYPDGVNVMWLVVPNKSSVYLSPEESVSAAREIAHDGLGPDLFAPMRSQRLKTVDLYMPDDTHLSTSGFLLLGDIALAWMRRTAGTPESAR